ncbi:hypothetical protein HKX48_006494 [Thoreauomyces humboldtii]|nr:hypothetical protein HKX48_006494 [Thoreauomyces humboldtii]
MPASAIAAARARVFDRDFTSLDTLTFPVMTYLYGGVRLLEKLDAIDFGPYRIWNSLNILHLMSEFGFLSDLQASVSAQQLASTDYPTSYDDLSAGRFWETLDTELDLLSNHLKALTYDPPTQPNQPCSTWGRIIDMTGFRCPLILAPIAALDDTIDTFSPNEMDAVLSRVGIAQTPNNTLRSQYKVVTSHHLDDTNADVTANLVMELHRLSCGPGFRRQEYEAVPECHPDEVRKTHFAFLDARYVHWLHLQIRDVCAMESLEDEWEGCLVDILVIRNVEKGRRVLGALVIQENTDP